MVSPEHFMIYIIVILVVLVLGAFAISFRLYVKDRRMHRHTPSSRHRKARSVPSYQLYAWIDEEVAKDKLYRKPDMSTIELADELGLDVFQLRSIIRKTYDKSVTEYLNERRVQAACRLLREQPDITLEEIRVETGFVSIKAFQDIFKTSMGQSPDKYREMLYKSNN